MPDPFDSSAPWHALPATDVMAALRSRSQGLTSVEVEQRRQAVGANVLPEPRRRNLATVLLGQFRSPFIYLLLAAAVLSLVLGDLADAGFIAVVLAMNAAIGAWQEWGAERRIRGLQSLVRSVVPVRRDGRQIELDGRDLVPGDVVSLATGLKVAADMRLLDGDELAVDESLLTGESVPATKGASAAVSAEAVPGDRATMLHAGATVLNGRATAIVVATGQHTQVGRIARSLRDDPPAPTPLVRRMAGFTRALTLGVAVVIAALATIEIVRGAPVAEILVLGVALAVSAIPEGLPVAMTVALSIAVRRMAARRVIVRRLPAVEGLGTCTTIASDKTGTLTLNRLTVVELWLPQTGFRPADDPGATTLALSAAICNEAWLGPDDSHEGGGGDAVDRAFLVLARDRGVLADARACPQCGAVPYEPELKYGAAFEARGETMWAHVKGAAETVLPMCVDVDPSALAAADALAERGFRVIAVASGQVPSPTPGSLGGLRLLGLAGILDPLRPDAPAAIAAARRAGIRVCMVTGDHPRTALAIARQLGLAEDEAEVVTGSDLAALEGDAFVAAVSRARVFARVEPMQKLAIVRALQAKGEIVAVTGDGVNDAPALRAADIGVAMAGNGTDVARDAADILLVDDNFGSIVGGIEEGRFAYANIRKVIALVVSTGAAEIVLFALAVLSGLPPPLTAVQLLWLNLVTNGIQDVALAFERGEPGALDRPPRPPEEPVFDRRMLGLTSLSGLYIGVASFAYYHWLMSTGQTHALAQGAVLWLLVCFENAHCLNCRSERRSVLNVPLAGNPLLLAGIAVTQLLQVGAMSMPAIGNVIGISPLPVDQWLLLVGLAFTVVPVLEIYKIVAGRLWRP